MKIRPRNNILYAATGVKFSSANAGGANWRQLVFNNYRQHLLDLLTKYGEANDYGEWLNEMQHRHSQLYNAANQSGNWEDIAYENEDVGKYQQDYRGGKGNNGNYLRFGTILLNPEDNYDFNQTGIKTNLTTRYNIPDPPKRTSGDFSREGYDYRVDNYYSGITDDRRLLGRKGDWDENSQEYKDWIKELNSRGWTMKLDPSDNYYKLKRLGSLGPNNLQQNPLNPQNPLDPNAPQTPGGRVPVNHKEPYKLDLSLLKKYLPNLLGTGRLIGNLWNNERVYGEALKGIKPDLRQTYLTHRQVLGDEGTRLGFYTRAALGQTRASRPFTSDADRQIAYQMEAKRIGDELRALGDLADNLEIRRTSDESNLHQWANTQRATEVANANIASMNAANALRHNLLALKHSANWTSIDNALLERETRLNQKQEYLKALLNLIWALDSQHRLENNVELLTSYQAMQDAYNKAYKKYNGDASKVTSDPTFKAAKLKYDDIKYRLLRLLYEEMLQRAKNGIKISYKKKDDLLYKTTRDAIEHFLRMSKISSDAQNRRKPKIEKLTSHPKKYQLGGVAPFTVYRPAPLGGESGISLQAGAVDLLGLNKASKASSGDKKNETLDMVKELFKAVQGKGLPSDVNVIYNSMKDLFARAKAFGTELTSDDIAGLYLLQMEELNKVQYMKENFDKARDIAISKDAMGEFAVNADGTYIVLKDGKIGSATLALIKEGGYNPLTNEQVLNLRAVTPGLAMDTSLFGAVLNGVGMTKIAEHIKSILPKLGTDELVREGYTHHEANQIVQGLEALQLAPAGDYKVTTQTKSQKEAAQKALYYIAGMLPKNMRAVLEINALERGTSFSQLLLSLVGSDTSNYSSIEFDAVTGKAAKDANGNSKEGNSEGLKLDAATALISGKGYLGPIEFNPGTSYAITVNARHSGFLKKSGENMGNGITMLEATTSTLGGILDWNKATLGGSKLSPTGYNRIMINNSDVVGVDLPVGSDKNVPDFTMLKKLQILDLELLKRGIEDTLNNWKQINLICQEIGLPAKYKNDGSLNEYSWNRFAAFLVISDDSVLIDKKAILNDILGIIEDDNIREQYEQIIRKNNNDKNYKLGSGFLGFGKQALYQGTVFVPINSNYVASALSGSLNISMLLATNLELKERGYDQLKIATYKPGIKINEL